MFEDLSPDQRAYQESRRAGTPGQYGTPGKTTPSATGVTGGSSDFQAILSKLLEELKPGGGVERAYMSDIDKEGKLLGSQLKAGSISRGLGNAQIGIPTTVFKQTSQAKQKLRADMSGQYMGLVQNLAQLTFQKEQADADRQMQAFQLQAQAGASRTGLDAFGKPMSGTLAAAEMDLAQRQMQVVTAQRPSAAAQPNLYAAGGYGAESIQAAPSLFGDIGPGADTGIEWATPLKGTVHTLKSGARIEY